MLQPLWAMLNIGLAIYFLYICINSIGLVRSQFGRWGALVFGFGVYAATCTPRNDFNHDRNNHFRFTSEDSIAPNTSHYERVELTRSLMNAYDLHIKYGRLKSTGAWAVTEAWSGTNGFSAGAYYIPKNISVNNYGDSTRFNFRVQASIIWILLGANIFNQQREYTKTVQLKE